MLIEGASTSRQALRRPLPLSGPQRVRWLVAARRLTRKVQVEEKPVTTVPLTGASTRQWGSTHAPAFIDESRHRK